jgi:hypothetical protein
MHTNSGSPSFKRFWGPCRAGLGERGDEETSGEHPGVTLTAFDGGQRGEVCSGGEGIASELEEEVLQTFLRKSA